MCVPPIYTRLKVTSAKTVLETSCISFQEERDGGKEIKSSENKRGGKKRKKEKGDEKTQVGVTLASGLGILEEKQTDREKKREREI